MTDDLRRRADALFDRALDLPAAERRAFVARESGGDVELRALVERLLAADGTQADLTPGGALGGALAAELDLDLDRAPGGLVGQTIGRWRIEEELGRGGMAVVYLAHRVEGDFEQRGALKLLRNELDSPEALRRFEIERQILARASHPHIAALLDGGVTTERRPYLVMEHVEGAPIDRYCDARRLDLSARLGLFLQVAHAVEHAHRGLVVHRDIKPSNILVTADGHAKLLDFGIAKLLDPDDADATRTAFHAMTPAFAAPEQVDGQPVTTATDVYQLGLLLYLLLTGCWPYAHDPRSEAEMLLAIRSEPPTRPSQALDRGRFRAVEAIDRPLTPDDVAADRATTPDRLRRALRGDLDTILLKALRKEPARRYGGVGELVGDLERHLAGRTISARPDTFGYRAGKFFARHRVASVVAGIGLATVIGLVSWDSTRLARERDRARLEAAKATEVSRFLSSLFAVSAPTRSRGESVTARELLDRGAARLDELGGQPELQAEMMTLVGSVYTELALFDEAETLLDRAVEIRRRVPGEDGLDLAASLYARGELAEKRRDFAAGRTALDEAIGLRRAALGDDHVEVAKAEALLGSLLAIDGQPSAARDLLEPVVVRLEAALGPDAVEVGRALNFLAIAVRDLRDYEASIPLYERAIEVFEQRLGRDHPYTVKALFNFAYSLRYGGDRPRAGEIYRASIVGLERLYGSEHPNLGMAHNNYANLLRDLERWDEAVAEQTRALEIWRAALGPDDIQIAWAHNNLGLIEQQRGDWPAAREQYELAVAVTGRAVAPDHAELAVPLRNLARALQAEGKSREALPHAVRALAIAEKTYGADHSFVHGYQLVAGELLLELGRPVEAEPHLRQAVELGRDDPEHRAGEVTAAKIALARCLLRLDRRAEAMALLEQERAGTSDEGRERLARALDEMQK